MTATSATPAPPLRQPSWRRAVRELAAADPVMARVIATIGPCRMVVRHEGTHFEHLARAIVYQQLSGKAAGTIHGRMLELFGGRAPTPGELLAVPDERFRGAGVSRQKLAYLRSLAEHCDADALPLDRIHALPDDEVIAALTAVKGIGRWTAQMFLMFRLGRPDVLPELDLGVQNGIRKAYRVRKPVTPRDVVRRGEKWRPWRSVASWYMWRVVDGEAQL
jgi:DNA-3-methyladenine glycosylase II